MSYVPLTERTDAEGLTEPYDSQSGAEDHVDLHRRVLLHQHTF